MAKESPVLVLNPLADERFVAEAERLVRANDVQTQDLQTALRKRYPKTVVHRRALSGESGLIWYVYRDGHWVPPYSLGRASGSR